MQKTASNSPIAEIKDARLFREACFVDGKWVQANSKQMTNVDNPATSEIVGGVPKLVAPKPNRRSKRQTAQFPPGARRRRRKLGPF